MKRLRESKEHSKNNETYARERLAQSPLAGLKNAAPKAPPLKDMPVTFSSSYHRFN